MTQITCPKCGEIFNIDDNSAGHIISQIRDSEFNKELEKRIDEFKKQHDKEHEHDLKDAARDAADKEKESFYKEKKDLEDKINKLDKKINDLENENKILKSDISHNVTDKEAAILKAVEEIKEENRSLERNLSAEKDKYEILLAQKNEQIEFYRDLKKKMSTKMVGETLEQHCEIQFNQLRATAFRNVYFEKDNDARTGSKGDYIYREMDESGAELISIMFEMKNENDETATKHKNEDFFKELDKDRREKNCEYAVLVSMLEGDSDLYNAGIVDVSHRYEKMYVVRPNCFIPIITVLRNAALNALSYKRELMVIRDRDVDVTNFENDLNTFKDAFAKNYKRAHDHFDAAIDEIDKTIAHLEKVKKELQGSDNQLRLANNKVDEVSVKRLTKNNPTMAKKFEEIKNN